MGTMRGTALATLIASLLWWWQLRAALHEFERAADRRDDLGADLLAGAQVSTRASAGRYRGPADPERGVAGGAMALL